MKRNWQFLHQLATILGPESNSEKILKIGKYLVKLWARVRCLVFLTHSVVKMANIRGIKSNNEYIISATQLTAQLTAQFVLMYAKR